MPLISDSFPSTKKQPTCSCRVEIGILRQLIFQDEKLMVLFLFFIACQANRRMYVNHTKGPYSIADNTLISQNEFIINRSGFQKIRNGGRLPKQYRVKQWQPEGIDAPIIRIDGKNAFWNNTIYLQIP